MGQGMRWFGRSGRLVIGGLLVFSAMAQPSIVGAQAAPGPLGPPNLGGTTLPTASAAILRGQDPYPRAATSVNVVRGGQTISVRPLQTTLLASGKEALQSRLLVSFTRTITDADLSDLRACGRTLHEAVFACPGDRARKARSLTQGVPGRRLTRPG